MRKIRFIVLQQNEIKYKVFMNNTSRRESVFLLCQECKNKFKVIEGFWIQKYIIFPKLALVFEVEAILEPESTLSAGFYQWFRLCIKIPKIKKNAKAYNKQIDLNLVLI